MDKIFTSCPILYEDEGLIFIDKPSGVLSHPNSSGRGRVAFNGRYHLSERRFDSTGASCWLVHRLDQDTSGVLLAAKSKEMAAKCRKQFEENSVTKEYRALVKGTPHHPKGEWRDHLTKEIGKGNVRSRIIKGKPPNAELHYRVDQTWSIPIKSSRAFISISQIDFRLISGKTHQIRVQAASRGHGLVGDDIYGDFLLNRVFSKEYGVRRLCLHASVLELVHPLTKKRVYVQSALPEEFKKEAWKLSDQKIR